MQARRGTGIETFAKRCKMTPDAIQGANVANDA